MTASHDAVWAALSGVVDPELDRPVTELGFVKSVRVDPAVVVELRLPTYFCAPNFAWLMVADARDALAALPGVTDPRVLLLDHFAADEINAAGSFSTAFAADGLDPDLTELRRIFERKAHVAAQERLARQVAPQLSDPAALVALTLAEAARLAPAAAAGVARRRARLGLVTDLALCDGSGAPLAPDALPVWLRFARTVRVSIDGNASLCRGLLRTRYQSR
ncbi:iron-sulfur cluster assembly protein [Paractinoplanes rishiriensis]|uniref:MIP18 family-like domain-containing protein n=1 Tax=Paractinoplanes rishiriensis TaxID=1050105 RepID=A0A919K0X7_9ACTN|nr:iron-sulfur cluster assembly protein [Actinoplanes rishiriensis]GIE97379.1 hypothetical protein Ari01nite_48440 [Actinoplanes rishiriensis]